jgi:hypothetical protein
MGEIRFNAGWQADRWAGGLLVGHHFLEPDAATDDDGGGWAEVIGFVAGMHVESPAELLRQLRLQWKAAGAAMRYNFPAAELVGWYAGRATRPDTEGSPTESPEPPAEATLLHHTFFNHPGQALLWLPQPDAEPSAWLGGGDTLRRREVGVLPPRGASR